MPVGSGAASCGPGAAAAQSWRWKSERSDCWNDFFSERSSPLGVGCESRSTRGSASGCGASGGTRRARSVLDAEV